MAKVLGDNLVRELEELIREKRGRRPRPLSNPQPSDELWTPEVYIARTPSGGIPALSEGADTGTDEAGLSDDEPGSAECDIWRIVIEPGVGTGEPTPQLAKVEFQKTVYNLSSTAIDGDAWVTVIRDKYGSWLVSVGGGSSDGDAGDGTITVVKVTNTTPTGDGYYEGKLQTYNTATNTWSDGADIYILNANP